MNILIIRLSSLGDIIHTFPMVQDIKQNYPRAAIDWLVDESFQDLIKINPSIDEIITIPLRTWAKNKLNFLQNFSTWKNKIQAQLCSKYYDYIIDAQGLLKSAALTKCFNGQVYGFGKNSIREKFAIFFYQHKIETGKQHLAIQKNRLLAARIFNYEIDQTQVNFGLTTAWLQQICPQNIANIPQSDYVVFFHATSKDSKKYPLLHWVTLAKYLITQYNLQIILPFGSATEQAESQQIKNLLQEYSNMIIVPEKRMSYFELVQLINSSFFIFGVDTGLVHLANALNQKLIAIYTDTNPQKTGIFATTRAKNIGNIGQTPKVEEIIDQFTTLSLV